MLRTACAEAAKWPDDINIAVNVSAIQLTSKNLINVVIGAIASAGLPANRLILEITESVFLENTFANLATLKSVHKLGVRFAMDDFGTGYSSLGYLLSFPFYKIKIDRSFIAGLPDKTESRAIVRAIADLAHNLNMRVVAEGVETAEQCEQACMLGCTDIQGYLISAPRPAAEICELLLTRCSKSSKHRQSGCVEEEPRSVLMTSIVEAALIAQMQSPFRKAPFLSHRVSQIEC